MCCHVCCAAHSRIKCRCLAWVEDRCFVSDTNIICQTAKLCIILWLIGKAKCCHTADFDFIAVLFVSLTSRLCPLCLCVCVYVGPGFNTLLLQKHTHTHTNSCSTDRSWIWVSESERAINQPLVSLHREDALERTLSETLSLSVWPTVRGGDEYQFQTRVPWKV